MTEPNDAAGWLAAWRDEPHEETPPLRPTHRADTIARLEARLMKLEAERAQSRRRRVSGVFAVAAGFAILAGATLAQDRSDDGTAARIQPEPTRTGAAPDNADDAPAARTPAPAVSAIAPPPRAPVSGAAPAPSAPSSTLEQENKLFDAATRAARDGEHDRALAAFDELLTKHPRSVLAPQARVLKLRLLDRTGKKDAAAREAARYLAEQPEGFARVEALKAVSSGTASASAPPPPAAPPATASAAFPEAP
jgi:TolA-binding protein